MVKMMMVINTHTFHDIDDKHYSNDDQRIEIFSFCHYLKKQNISSLRKHGNDGANDKAVVLIDHHHKGTKMGSWGIRRVRP